MNRYKSYYSNIICYDPIYKDNFQNPMQFPKFQDVILNVGLGQRAILDRKQIITTLSALELITAQKACHTRAKKSIDKFKLRQNMLIGCKVTLRNNIMYNFMDTLTHKVLPNIDEISDYITRTKKNKEKLSQKKNNNNSKGVCKVGSTLRKRYFFYDTSINLEISKSHRFLRRNVPNDETLSTRTTPTSFSHPYDLIGTKSGNGSSTRTCRSFSMNKYQNRKQTPIRSSFATAISFSFGLPDFFVFGNVPYDKFSSDQQLSKASKPYGMNITIRIKQQTKRKSNHLCEANYFLSCFQFPLGIRS